jgi:hypothetical protein
MVGQKPSKGDTLDIEYKDIDDDTVQRRAENVISVVEESEEFFDHNGKERVTDYKVEATHPKHGWYILVLVSDDYGFVMEVKPDEAEEKNLGYDADW